MDSDNQKKRKIDESESTASNQSLSAFANFKIHRVLREDRNTKLVTLHGFYSHGDASEKCEEGEEEKTPAVILLERKAFETHSLQQCLQDSSSTETLKNDIYSTHDVFSSRTEPDIKATIIHPATEKHIAKYSDHEPFIVRETAELYQSVTLPCLENSQFSIQWVYNILEKKTESERIVAEDSDPETGFILLPDMKWNRKDIDSLYLVALVHKHGIKSLRDLRKEHIPLLKNILNKGMSAIKENYNVTEEKLRIYIHYQPSYYHLHIHFTHLKWEAPGFDALRAHLLEDVIENLETDSEFYRKKTLFYTVRDNNDLYSAYVKSGYFQS